MGPLVSAFPTSLCPCVGATDLSKASQPEMGEEISPFLGYYFSFDDEFARHRAFLQTAIQQGLETVCALRGLKQQTGDMILRLWAVCSKDQLLSKQK